MKRKTMTKFITMALAFAMTFSVPLTSYAAVRDNVGGGTLEGKTEIESGTGTNSVDHTTGSSDTSVTIDEATGTGKTNKILENYQAYANGILYTGTMKNFAGVTKAASTVAESETNALITIPAAGYYTTTSKISVPVETIKNNVSALNSSSIIDAVNSRGGSLSSNASNTQIANAIKELNLHTLGTVSYEFHFCDSTCWRGCTGTMYLISDGDSPGGYQYDYQCRSCGARRTTYSPGNTIPCLNNAKICGHNSGDIVSATIVY